jgi:translation initiation factor 1
MRERLVYSSGKGRICPKCGWPAEDCHCASSLLPDAPVPTKITAKLSVANTSSGKRVTVIDGLPRNAAFLEALARELKKSCGTGGRIGEGAIELQGDQRERLHDLLSRKGWTVRGMTSATG